MELDEVVAAHLIESDESKTTIKGQLTGAPELLDHEDQVYFVGRATVGELKFPRKKGITTRHHVADVDRSTVVERALAIDLIEEDEERRTGQMRLLSDEGETRRAARLAASKRFEMLAAGANVAMDDGLSEEDMARFVKDAVRKIVDLSSDPATLALEPIDFFETVEEQFVVVAAMALTGVEWARRRIADILSVQREEAAAKTVTVDGNGTALTDAEAAEARGDVPPDATEATGEKAPEPVDA